MSNREEGVSGLTRQQPRFVAEVRSCRVTDYSGARGCSDWRAATAPPTPWGGWESRRIGELLDTDSLAAGARACEGVIHAAFIHDFSAYAAAYETGRRAVEALVGALEGSGKTFVLTSGTALLAPGRTGTEEEAPAPGSAAGLRAASETTIYKGTK